MSLETLSTYAAALLIPLAWTLGTVVHELGHATVARLLDRRVLRVHIGPFSFRPSDRRWSFRGWRHVHKGSVELATLSVRRYRAKSFAVSVAGPLATLLLALAWETAKRHTSAAAYPLGHMLLSLAAFVAWAEVFIALIYRDDAGSDLGHLMALLRRAPSAREITAVVLSGCARTGTRPRAVDLPDAWLKTEWPPAADDGGIAIVLCLAAALDRGRHDLAAAILDATWSQREAMIDANRTDYLCEAIGYYGLVAHDRERAASVAADTTLATMAIDAPERLLVDAVLSAAAGDPARGAELLRQREATLGESGDPLADAYARAGYEWVDEAVAALRPRASSMRA